MSDSQSSKQAWPSIVMRLSFNDVNNVASLKGRNEYKKLHSMFLAVAEMGIDRL